MNKGKTKEQSVANSIVNSAVKLAGGVSAVAKLISEKFGKPYPYQAVQSWVSQDRIPPKYIPIISEKTGIKKNLLDPVVFQDK